MKKDSRLFHMKLQFFAEDGEEAADPMDMSGLDEFLNGAEGEDTEEPEENPAEDEATEESEEETPAELTKPDKATQSFAFMRTQLAERNQLLTKLATAAGIEFTNEKDLFAKLNDNALTALAQKQNVPKEILQRMELLEQDSKVLQQTRLKDAAFLGFQNVLKTYELTQKELTAFAAELDEKGKNPFLQPVNLEEEYKLSHMEEIINKRVEKAVQAALTKSNAADKHSTTPPKQQGSAEPSGESISTVAGLDAFLNGMAK